MSCFLKVPAFSIFKSSAIFNKSDGVFDLRFLIACEYGEFKEISFIFHYNCIVNCLVEKPLKTQLVKKELLGPH